MMSWIKQLQAYQGGWGRLVVLLAGELLDCLTDMLQALCKWGLIICCMFCPKVSAYV